MDYEEVKKFIHEMRKKPMLWDTNLKDYKNQLLKKKAWIEVCKIACPSYVEKSEDERKQIVKNMHIKWKNLRDAYIRHIRLVTTSRKERKSQRIKPYIYTKQMDFLRRIINCRPTSNSLRSMDRNDDVSNDSDSMEETTSTSVDINQTTSMSPSLGRRETRLENKSIGSVDYEQQQQVQSGHHEFQEENDDMAFYRSLLPTLRMLRPEQKLNFRIDVMKLLTVYTTSQERN
ncbi:hypothetical protein KPH14_008660 [Odynerus spinipes]|uniref:MADF domain-containing protein n=1 Tax=Odynerus spinipes TaxID=1348599 RepID=A0AAD9RTW2_9HYME|nr:hypothetical protein KPH14_008660 [Odynerus spinipes]